MSLFFLFLKSTVYTNGIFDWPIFLILLDLDCIALLMMVRTIWTIRHWR